jgi:hypothetical protein
MPRSQLIQRNRAINRKRISRAADMPSVLFAAIACYGLRFSPLEAFCCVAPKYKSRARPLVGCPRWITVAQVQINLAGLQGRGIVAKTFRGHP